MKTINSKTETSRNKYQSIDKSDSNLIIQSQGLERWINSLNKSNGLYFLDITDEYQYNINYKDHDTGELMKMDYALDINGSIDPKKEFLDKLLLDLSLFKGTEPILVFDKQDVEICLSRISLRYHEYRKDIFSIIQRLKDIKQVFEEKWYHDSSFREITPKGTYEVLFPDQAYDNSISNSFALYQMFMTIQSIHWVTSNMRIAA